MVEFGISRGTFPTKHSVQPSPQPTAFLSLYLAIILAFSCILFSCTLSNFPPPRPSRSLELLGQPAATSYNFILADSHLGSRPDSGSPNPPTNNMSSNPSHPRTNSPVARSGVLTIKLNAARGLALPPALPAAIQEALKTSQGQTAASVTPSSVLEARTKRHSQKPSEEAANGNGRSSTDRPSNRESVQRKQCWWLPYCVLAFDKNEIMVEALGGDVGEPVWMYSAHL